MKHLIIFISAFLLSAILISCSDLQEDITTPELPGFHGKDIYNPISPDYHGRLVAESQNNMLECQQCHGSDYAEGIVEVGCTSSNCHPSINVHTDQIMNPNSSDFHGKFIASKFTWDMRDCAKCHGFDYSGGIVSPTCLTCHTEPAGPEACNTCHGDFADSSRIAPPRALNGGTTPDIPGVGSHNVHLYDNELGARVRCSSCHTFPSSFYADGHLGDDNRAEVIFGRVAITGGITPVYDFENNTCSDTYCHGNFVFYRDSTSEDRQFAYKDDIMVGNNVTVKWTEGDEDADCGSCHGLPPTGHKPYGLNVCGACHDSVVDNAGNIIDPTKHINGVADLSGG
ncbi:MAG: hypothetical protein MUO34_10375 [Ignavibacteriaceae bacterium]|nr:hypothetical protein [Ignavibacteriaceae bacterium]